MFIFTLFAYWYPKMRNRFLYRKCSSLKEATFLCITGIDDNIEVVKVMDKTSDILMNDHRSTTREDLRSCPYV